MPDNKQVVKEVIVLLKRRLQQLLPGQVNTAIRNRHEVEERGGL